MGSRRLYAGSRRLREREVARRNGYSERQIKALEDSGRERGSDTRRWVRREKPLPISRIVAIHTQDQINGGGWRLLSEGTKDVCIYNVDSTEIMGVDIGKVNFWSEPFVNDRGLEGYNPVKVTAARPYREHQPGNVISINAEDKARLMREPEYGEPKPSANVLAFQTPTRDDRGDVHHQPLTGALAEHAFEHTHDVERAVSFNRG
jgi:hypothetical protein